MMGRIVSLLFCLVILGIQLFPQSAVDSLKQRLSECANPDERVTLLNQLAYELNYADPNQAIAYATEALGVAQSSGDQSGAAAAYRNQAIVYQNLANYDQALIFADSSLLLFECSRDSVGIAGSYTTLGNIRCYLSEFTQAISYYEKAYEIYIREGLTSRAATLLSNIAWANSEMGNDHHALETYFSALKLQEKTNNEQGIALTMNNIGIAYFNLKNFDKALEYYHKALEIRERIDDPFGMAASCSNIGNALGMKGESALAMPYFERALKIFEKTEDRNSMAIVYSQVGHYLILDGMEEEGMAYLRKSIQINEETGNIHSLAYVLLEHGLAELKRGNEQQAFRDLNRCRDIFTETGNMDLLAQAYEALARYYEQTGQYRKALMHFRDYNRIRDSLFTGQTKDRVAAAEWQYESEKSKAENARLLRDKALTELAAHRNRQSRNIFLVISLVLLIIAVLIFLQYRLKRKLTGRLQDQNRELEEKREQIARQKEKLENQFNKLKELDEMKTRFFANISHEFRTPLTLIGGPLDDVLASPLAETLPDEVKEQISLAQRNVRQLSNLTNQLLDLSRLKAGKMKLKARRTDLVEYLRRTINTFESAIPRHKTITILFQSCLEQLCLYSDPEKLDQIINNLISNAIKSIEVKGEIRVSLSVPPSVDIDEEREGLFATIRISDTGKGISPADMPRIFDRFFRADDSGQSAEPGTGIGLEISRELVELHGGSVSAESEPGKGTTFTVLLPLGKEHLEPEEIMQDDDSEKSASLFITHRDSIDMQDSPVSEDKVFTKTSHPGEPVPETAFRILLVEDNPDMRKYIAGQLSGKFLFTQVANGFEALHAIVADPPDLIISDLMMPGMDGLALLEQVRESPESGHIPFILLTAKAGEEDRLAGYKLRADAYITKPFQPEILLTRVRNLLETHRFLRDTYGKRILSVELDREGLTSADQQFLEKMKDVVIRHISDPDLGVGRLAEAAFLSERQIRRKITDLTGFTPVDFIRQIRLQQAKILIENQAYETIAEVSAAVGFNHPAYFTRLFRKMFDQSPVELMRLK